MPAAVIEPDAVRSARAARLRGLYAVTPDLDDTTLLLAKVEAAIAGGAAAIQYRHKDATAHKQAEQAQALADLCRSRGTLFIVNDDAALASTVAADGVHLGRGDGDIAGARAIVGRHALIGVSCYDNLERARALAPQADYLAFGSLFASSVKPAARRAPLAILRQARALGLPVVGIGGIDARNAGQAIAAGADALAVINAVFASEDVETAARRIATACASARGA